MALRAASISDGRPSRGEGRLAATGRGGRFEAPGFAALERGEHLSRALDHRSGHAGELGDVDAVAAVGAAGDDAVQEDDLAVLLRRRRRCSCARAAACFASSVISW